MASVIPWRYGVYLPPPRQVTEEEAAEVLADHQAHAGDVSADEVLAVERDEEPPPGVRRETIYGVLRIDYPKGAPETARPRLLGFWRWAWLAILHGRLIGWSLRLGRAPFGIGAVGIELVTSTVWRADEDPSVELSP